MFFAPPHRTHCTPTFHTSQPALAVHTQISASPPPLFAYSQFSCLFTPLFSFTLLSWSAAFFLPNLYFLLPFLTHPTSSSPHFITFPFSFPPPPHLLIIILLSISLDISFPLEAFGPENCLFVFLSSSLSLLFHPPFSSLSVLKRWYRIASSVFTAFFSNCLHFFSLLYLSSISLSLYLSISLSLYLSLLLARFNYRVYLPHPGRSLAAFFLRRCRVSFQAFSIFLSTRNEKINTLLALS
jgi:hypothetical protein